VKTLKVWIGHYKGNPKEWFVVWAENKHEAGLQIDPVAGEPDMRSLKELKAPGFVDFTADFGGDTGSGLRFLPPEGDVVAGYWLVFGGASGKSDKVEEYILKKAQGKRE